MAQQNERKVILTIPRELGLSEEEVDKLKEKFKNDILQSMPTTARTVIIIIVVVYV